MLDLTTVEQKQIEDAINRKALQSAPLHAEIAEGSVADWYLVRAINDVRAMRWLARRRFGVFRPMQQRVDRQNGVIVQGWEPVFPGFLLVFVWDIARHASRINNCPGVCGILCDPITMRPVAVDQQHGDDVSFVERLRALSWLYEDGAPRLRRIGGKLRQLDHAVMRQRRRLTMRERREIGRLKHEMKARKLWVAADWIEANQLAPEQRIALMRRYLNLN